MTPIDKLYQDSKTIQSFVQEMGTPAVLLIWPLGRAQRVTELALHQQPVVFVVWDDLVHQRRPWIPSYTRSHESYVYLD